MPDDQEIDLFADGVEVTKVQLLLSDAEFCKLLSQFYELIRTAAEYRPAPGRKRRAFSLTVIPVEELGEKRPIDPHPDRVGKARDFRMVQVYLAA